MSIESNQTLRIQLEEIAKMEETPSITEKLVSLWQGIISFGQEVLNQIFSFPIVIIVALLILLAYLLFPK